MWQRPLQRNLIITFNIVLISLVTFDFHNKVTTGQIYPNVYIASKSIFDDTCVDPQGAARNHLEEWTESGDTCTRRICYSKANETLSYAIHYDCPAQLEDYDTTNCQYASGSVTTFPDCCPELQCTNGSLPNTTTPACYDRSPTTSCEFWKNLTNCFDHLTDTHLSFLYNLTIGYCEQTYIVPNKCCGDGVTYHPQQEVCYRCRPVQLDTVSKLFELSFFYNVLLISIL